jgi:flavin reductase ActVB
MTTVSAHNFKAALSHLVGAVTIVTTRDADGQPWGFTATSFCSLSLDPPLVLVCLATSADCYPAFTTSPRFAVNLLSTQQRDLSQRFATKGTAKYRETQFEDGPGGLPLLPESLAYMECRVRDIYPGGDHIILVGLVEHTSENTNGYNDIPLLYYARTYGTFTPL